MPDEQQQTEERALTLLGTHVRGLASRGAAYQRAEMAALYIAAKAYTLDNEFDLGLMEALNDRAQQIVDGWKAERAQGKR